MDGGPSPAAVPISGREGSECDRDACSRMFCDEDATAAWGHESRSSAISAATVFESLRE